MSSFDLLFVGGIIYLSIHMTQNWDTLACKTPIRAWLMIDYINLIFARSLLFLFELSYKPMRFATTATVFCLAPWHLLWTFIGTHWYRQVLHEEFSCLKNYPYRGVILCALSFSWFLVFIYGILGLGALLIKVITISLICLVQGIKIPCSIRSLGRASPPQ